MPFIIQPSFVDPDILVAQPAAAGDVIKRAGSAASLQAEKTTQAGAALDGDVGVIIYEWTDTAKMKLVGEFALRMYDGDLALEIGERDGPVGADPFEGTFKVATLKPDGGIDPRNPPRIDDISDDKLFARGSISFRRVVPNGANNRFQGVYYAIWDLVPVPEVCAALGYVENIKLRYHAVAMDPGYSLKALDSGKAISVSWCNQAFTRIWGEKGESSEFGYNISTQIK